MTIYAEQHTNEYKIVRIVYTVFFGISFLVYVPPALVWLSTIVFGIPSADSWEMPSKTDQL